MEAAEYRCGSLKPALHQKTKDDKMADCYQEIHNELALLGACLRSLVKDLSTLPETQRESLLQLQQQAWNDPAVSRALEQRLGDSHQAFQHTLADILCRLDAIVSNQALKLDRKDLLAQQASRPLYEKLVQLRKESGANSESFKTRVKFTSKEARLRKSLREVTKNNKLLERLVNGAPVPDVSNIVGDATIGDTPPRKICELALALYTSLTSVWSCNCESQHEARLCMNVPYGPEEASMLTRLDMFISTNRADARTKWQESRVHLDTDVQPEVVQVDAHARVRFEGQQAGAPNRRKRRRSSATEPLSRLDAMCSLIDNTYHSNVVLEMMLNKDSLWQIRSSRPRAKVQEPQPDTTLQHILSSAKRLREKDRRRLAVILANALLHLKDSHWIADNWTKRDICFMIMGDEIDFSRPYLASKFPRRADSGDTDNPSLMQLHQSPALLGLGVMLLELGISAPIETKRLDEDLMEGIVGVNTDLITAERVLNESVDDLHYGYRAAVKACLDYEFVPPDGSFDFSDDTFRSLVYKHVVQPLEMELYHGWKIKVKDLW